MCVKPGTELAFDYPITVYGGSEKQPEATVAIFRQFNLEQPMTHHDALELPDGERVYLTCLMEGQQAVVLQLPAAPKTATEAKAQERLEVVG